MSVYRAVQNHKRPAAVAGDRGERHRAPEPGRDRCAREETLEAPFTPAPGLSGNN
jgi:hypothetical protein